MENQIDVLASIKANLQQAIERKLPKEQVNFLSRTVDFRRGENRFHGEISSFPPLNSRVQVDRILTVTTFRRFRIDFMSLSFDDTE